MPQLSRHLLFWLMAWTFLGIPGTSHAEYFRQKESELDHELFRIDEKQFLGIKPEQDVVLIDQAGKSFKFGDMIGKPLVLVFSYYQCDGSCSAVNGEVIALLERVVKTMRAGEDYRVLTISFDKADTQETMTRFIDKLHIPPELKPGWTFARLADPARIKDVTGKTGFKFFWATQDKIFYHPNVAIILTNEGRISRYLYLQVNSTLDMQIALMEARQGEIKPHEFLNYAISLCYSYNYKEGRYTYNIPVFVGVGAFLFGISMLVVSVFYYKIRHKHKKEGSGI
ncbi:MAG: SCO family protein [Magnetococcales bacterium]|nr:SCO family protein [Magnetococcales bacterium]MBF0322495.1 SCO family protein [Magnetococcales bacterium]